jgi:nucleotide-binding universal stress UspA family protein
MNYKKAIIAVDNSPTAEKVAREGLEFARQLNAETALVSVVDTTFLMTDGSVTPAEMAVIMKNDLRKLHQALIEKLFGKRNVQTFVGEGKPHEIILDISKQWDADLIVIGTHGRTGFSHLLMGSVAEKVLRNSKKPLLVVPVKHEN